MSTPEQHQWCPNQENLLKRWAEKAAGYRWLHNHARVLYKRQHDWLSYPSIIISSITGVGGFAVLSPDTNSMSEDQKQKIIIFQYFFAFMNVIAGILTSISKFNNSARFMEMHSVMSVQYSKLYRNIDMELSLETQHREDVLEFVNKTRVEYDRLLDEAPDIPSESINAFNGLSVINCGEETSSPKNWIFKKRPGTPISSRPSVELKSYNSEERV